MANKKNVTNADVRDALISLGVLQPGQQIDLAGAQNGYFKNGLMANLGINQDQFDAAKTMARWDGSPDTQGDVMSALNKVGINLSTSGDASVMFQRIQDVRSGKPPTSPIPGTQAQATPTPTSPYTTPTTGTPAHAEVPRETAAAAAAAPVTPAPPITPAPLGSAAAKKAGAPGGTKVVADVTTLPKPMSPAEAENIIKNQYGYMGSLMDEPDIHKILYGIADGSIAPTEFQHQVMATDWYQHRNDAQVAYETLKSTHPEQLKATIQSSADNLKSSALAMGFTLTDEDANSIATSALSMGWDDAQTRNALGAHYQYTTGQTPVAGVAKTLKTTAANFLVPVSDQALTQWGQQMIQGTATMDQFEDYARTQAKAQYPGLGAWLDADPTRNMKQFVDPYQQQASNILEIPPDQIDFTSPKYQALFGKLDPKTGDKSVMTGPEWATYLKQQPEWQYTKNAHDTVAGLTDTLAKTFGTVGNG